MITGPMSTEYFAAMLILEIAAFGILAIALTAGALLVWDWLTGRFR